MPGVEGGKARKADEKIKTKNSKEGKREPMRMKDPNRVSEENNYFHRILIFVTFQKIVNFLF